MNSRPEWGGGITKREMPVGTGTANDTTTSHRLLDRLERVSQRDRGRWMACCPAHDDRSPSLSIREGDDGRVLLHCFAGCDVGSIVAAVGLQLADLFPVRLEPARSRRPRFPWRDVLDALRHEVLVVAVAAGQIDVLTAEDVERVHLAERRIRAGLEVAGGS